LMPQQLNMCLLSTDCTHCLQGCWHTSQRCSLHKWLHQQQSSCLLHTAGMWLMLQQLNTSQHCKLGRVLHPQKSMCLVGTMTNSLSQAGIMSKSGMLGRACTSLWD
jgi:hypothetical protein